MKFAIVIFAFAVAGTYGDSSQKHPKNLQAKSPVPPFNPATLPRPEYQPPLNGFGGSSLSDVYNNMLQGTQGGNGRGGSGTGVINVNDGSLAGNSNATGGDASSKGSIGDNSSGIGSLATAGNGLSHGGTASIDGGNGGDAKGGRGGYGLGNSWGNTNSQTGSVRSKHHETKHKGQAKEKSAHAKQRNKSH